MPETNVSHASGVLPKETSSLTAGTKTTTRRRNRMINSCLECRRRKLRCDKGHPCLNCSKSSRDCVFIAPALDAPSQLKLAEIKEKVDSLERLLERDVARGSRQSEGEAAAAKVDADADADDAPDDERHLEPSPLAVNDVLYEHDADDDLFDLGIQFGKLRLTERIGGFFRPRFAEELHAAIAGGHDHHAEPDTDAPRSNSTLSGAALRALFQPGPSYIAPSTAFFFDGGAGYSSLADFLPVRETADLLMGQYYAAVHPIARTMHRPSFDASYRRFWAAVAAGIEPAPSTQALLFAAMLSGAASMAEETINRHFAVRKQYMLDHFRSGCEQALCRAKFLRSSKMETLQALVTYLIALCRDQVSRAHSALTGTAIRIAQCIGLHRDGESYGLGPIENHVRRLIWHQLCFLDLRTCEAQGPQPTIRKDEYDTRLPCDLDDVDLGRQTRQTSSTTRWTEMTFSRIRFECYEMHRCLWVDRPRLEKKQISLTQVLGKIETFRKTMEGKYMNIIDDRIPIQRAAKVVMTVLIARLYVTVLHRYVFTPSKNTPDRIKQMTVDRGLSQLEAAIKLETDPLLATWAWYAGAYQQYQSAILLLIEIILYPRRPEADRIWKCCDYIFETNPTHSRAEKARFILDNIRDRASVYRDLRKVRAPKSVADSDLTTLYTPVNPMNPPKVSQPSKTNRQVTPPAGVPRDERKVQDVAPSAAHAGGLTTAENIAHTTGNDGVVPAVATMSASCADPSMPEIDWNEWNAIFPPDNPDAGV